ncbi:MAG TPA: OsmC family protein [Gemmatimonadales bacterium]|nr:OsmC family protein [Gemmatimonadales bacterium]
MTSPVAQEAAQRADHKQDFAVTLTLNQGYAFQTTFDGTDVPALVVDEQPPLGAAVGPNPARMLATAVGHCLSSSMLFCLRKAKIEPEALHTTVTGFMVRNERGRLRIGGLRVSLDPVFKPVDRERAARCLELFQDFCIVTESVKHGIDVQVAVSP